MIEEKEGKIKKYFKIKWPKIFKIWLKKKIKSPEPRSSKDHRHKKHENKKKNDTRHHNPIAQKQW